MAGERYSLGIRDYSREDSGFGFGVGAVTVVTLPVLLGQIAAFRLALSNIILGTQRFDELTAFHTPISALTPTDQNAQRERKWVVHYTDNTQYFDPPTNAIPNEGFGKAFVFSIPTADLSGTHLIPNLDLANLTDPDVAAFVTAFQNMARSPYGGVALVTSIEAVGRNL